MTAGLEAEKVVIIVTTQTTIRSGYRHVPYTQSQLALGDGSVRFGKYQNKATIFEVSRFCGTRGVG